MALAAINRCVAVFALSGAGLFASPAAAQNQLELGYYVLAQTNCGSAANVDISLVHWSGINAARTICEFSKVVPAGRDRYDFVQSCQEIGLAGAQEVRGQITLVSDQEFELRVDGGTFRYRFCAQAQLPEPWRSVDISDIQR